MFICPFFAQIPLIDRTKVRLAIHTSILYEYIINLFKILYNI